MNGPLASTGRRVAYGAVARLLGRSLGAIVTLVALRQATRYFGPVEWGPITAALAWFAVFSALGTPGVATLGMREIAQPGADTAKVFGRSLAATAVASVLALTAAAGLGAVVYWTKADTLDMTLVVVCGIPAMALFQTSGASLAGRGRSDVRALLDVVSSLLLLGATLVVVHEHLHQLGYATAYLCYLAASGLVAVALATKFLHPLFEQSARGVAGHLKRSLPLGQFDVFAAAYARADSIMLFFIKGNRPVALYGVAFQIVTFLFIVPTLLTNALLPDYLSESPERRRYLARRGFDVVLTLALPLPIFGVVFGRALVVWIAGDRFAAAGTLLAILTGAAVMSFVNGYLFQMAVFSGAERGLWRAVALVTAINLASNAVAVTLFGATGAAVVMILSEAVGLALYWRIYRASLPSPLGRRYPASVALACAAFAALCAGLEDGMHLSSGNGAGMIPRGIALFAIYLALVGIVAAAARQLSTRLRSPVPSDR